MSLRSLWDVTQTSSQAVSEEGPGGLAAGQDWGTRSYRQHTSNGPLLLIPTVQQDVWCRCAAARGQVLPGGSAGSGLRPHVQTRSQADMPTPALPH